MTVYAIYSLACNDCDTHYPASPDVINSDATIVAAALTDGWTRGNGPRRRNYHRCPACTTEAERVGAIIARGICPVCGTSRALNAVGNLRQHNKPASPGNRRWTGWCDGSRKPPLTAGPVNANSGEETP